MVCELNISSVTLALWHLRYRRILPTGWYNYRARRSMSPRTTCRPTPTNRQSIPGTTPLSSEWVPEARGVPNDETRSSLPQPESTCGSSDPSAGINKTIALSASQIVAPLFLHYTWCACRHRSRIGQVHRLLSGSDGTRVVREATLLTPLCAWLHKSFSPSSSCFSPPQLWREKTQDPHRIRVRNTHQPNN
jgi:hypothetical protein